MKTQTETPFLKWLICVVAAFVVLGFLVHYVGDVPFTPPSVSAQEVTEEETTAESQILGLNDFERTILAIMFACLAIGIFMMGKSKKQGSLPEDKNLKNKN